MNLFKIQGAKKRPQANLGFIPLAKHASAVKFLPSYRCKSIQLGLVRAIGDTVCGSTELAAFCSLLGVFQHLHLILKGISKSPFHIHCGTLSSNSSILAYTICILLLWQLAPILWRSFPLSLLNWYHTSFTEFPIVLIFSNLANNSSSVPL